MKKRENVHEMFFFSILEVRPAKKPARKRKSNSSTVSGGTESPVSSAPTTPTKKRSSTNSLSNSNSTRDGNFTPGVRKKRNQ